MPAIKCLVVWNFIVSAALVLGACLTPPPLPAAPAIQLTIVAQSPPAATPSTELSTPAPALEPSTAVPAAAVATPTQSRVKVTSERQKLTSQALAGNLPGDPTERGFYVVLPPDYASSGKRYPVVYGLHGWTGNEYSDPMLFQGALQSGLRRGEVKELILVFPDAGNKLGGNMYLSSPTMGDYETYLTKELVDYIDANYRTIPNRDSRGITGCSMGADGAVHLALKYPDVFSVAAPYSGTYEWAKDPWLTLGAKGFQREPADLSEFLDLPRETRWGIAMAAAVTPNPDKPPFFLDMPYVRGNGGTKLAPGFVEKVEAASPVQDANNYVEQPLRLRGILIYHGVNDEYVPDELVREFDALLTELGIEHEYLEVDAMHCGMDLKPILKFMSDNLVFEDPAR